MSPLQILMVLQGVLELAAKAGISWVQFKELRDKAEAENRDLTIDELKALADKAQAAIDKL